MGDHQVRQSRSLGTAAIALASLLLLVSGCRDSSVSLAGSATTQPGATPTQSSVEEVPGGESSASLRSFPLDGICDQDQDGEVHGAQDTPVYVSGGSIPAGNEADTPEELRDVSDAVVEGIVSRLAPGRSNEYWGYVDIYLDVNPERSDRSDDPEARSISFEHILCNNPSGRRVVTENDLDDIAVGDRLKVYLRNFVIDAREQYVITNGVGLFRVIDGQIEKTNRDDAVIRQVEGRPVSSDD